MAFDLGNFKQAAVDKAEVTIQDPVSGEATDIKISLYSPDSDEYKRRNLQLQNDNIKYIRKNRGKTTAERIAQESMDLLVAMTCGWTGLEENGEAVPFTPDNVRRVYTQFPFIKEQVDEFLGDRRNFIKR